MLDGKIITNDDSSRKIKDMIFVIRGVQVILDSDVALLYGYTTKRINETVSRNKKRFPENFCFQLTEEETLVCNWSQFATSYKKGTNKNRGNKYLPYVFTEQGIAMLSGLLKSEIAIEVSVSIMNAFVEMRKFLQENGQIFRRLTNIEYKLLEHDDKFDKLFKEFDLGDNVKQRIFYDGEIYDAYSLVINIFKKANSKIIVIDNYIDNSVLTMLSKKNKDVDVVIYTSSKNSKINSLDVEKFNQEYPLLTINYTSKIHDRFIIIDDVEMYHLGASIKDVGKKCFGINKISEKNLIDSFIKYL